MGALWVSVVYLLSAVVSDVCADVITRRRYSKTITPLVGMVTCAMLAPVIWPSLVTGVMAMALWRNCADPAGYITYLARTDQLR